MGAPTLPTITTQVVTDTHLPRESSARAERTSGTIVRLFADGVFVGTVEVPPRDYPGADLELVASPVHERSDGRSFAYTPPRCQFPNGGAVDYKPADIAEIEREHSLGPEWVQS